MQQPIKIILIISLVQLICSGQLPRVHRPVQRGGQAEWLLRRFHDESRPLRVKDLYPGNERRVAGEKTGGPPGPPSSPGPPGNKTMKCFLSSSVYKIAATVYYHLATRR